MDPRYARRLPNHVYLGELLRDKRVLELGTGEGHSAPLLLRAGAAKVTGVDRTARAVEAARIRHRASGLDFQVADYAALPFADASFDVVCVPAGADVVRRQVVLLELRRVLAPDGLLALAVPSGDRADARSGVPFHELSELIGSIFGTVRMIATTPFIGYSLVEFGDEATEVTDIELDTQLADWGGADTAPTDYLALAGPAARSAAPRGFVVVQLPTHLGVAAVADLAPGEEPPTRRATTVPPPVAAGVPAAEDGELRRRATRLAEEKTALEAEAMALRARLAEDETELGRVAAQTSREVAELRTQLSAAQARGAELDAGLATAKRENLSLRDRLDASAPEGGRGGELARKLSEAQAELTFSRGEVDKAHKERGVLADRVLDLEAELRRAAAPTPASEADLLSVLSDASRAHTEELSQLRSLLDERDAYVDELRDELGRALAVYDQLRTAASKADAHATGLEAELREVRARMARAEGEALKLKLRSPAAAAPAPVVTAPVITPAPVAPAERRASKAEPDAGVLARVAELEKALAERTDAADKAISRAKAAEIKTDEMWRKVGEMQRELEQNRASGVETAKVQRQSAQVSLTRAVEEAGRKLVTAQDQLARAERERADLDKKLAEQRLKMEAAWRERSEALAAVAAESEAVRRERDATVSAARGELELQLAAASRRKQIEQKLLVRVEELEQRLGELEGGLRSEEQRLGNLEDGLRSVHQSAGAMTDPSQLQREVSRHVESERVAGQALVGREEKLRRVNAELGDRDAELALLHGRIAHAERQVSEMIAAVRRISANLAGRSAVEVAALLDRLAAEAAEAVRG